MDHVAWAGLVVLRLIVPLLLVALADFVGVWRAKATRTASFDTEPAECFEILVPIYGSVDYLETVDFLRPYGAQVLLCTTSAELPAFYHDLEQIAAENHFRIFTGDVDRAAGTGRRATGGVIRDRLIRDALHVVTAPYVVCIDADTATTRPLGELVGAMVGGGFDLVSIRLVPSNRGSLLARLQVVEYRIAMDLRRILPWLVSGACHAASTPVLRDVMSRHSLFFQGNDVELGILAEARGYRVGHIPFEVPTTVPERLTPWLRQRLAWAGGGVRLFVANPQLGLRHPFVWAYGLLLGLCAFPLRWMSLAPAGLALLAVAALYLLLCFLLERDQWEPTLLLMPLYAAITSLILVPLGLIWYVHMAVADRNPGLIRPHRQPATVPTAAGRQDPVEHLGAPTEWPRR
jgi:Glycosyl transferase family group 2